MTRDEAVNEVLAAITRVQDEVLWHVIDVVSMTEGIDRSLPDDENGTLLWEQIWDSVLETLASAAGKTLVDR